MNEKKQMSIWEAAQIMEISEHSLRILLQRKSFPWGMAWKGRDGAGPISTTSTGESFWRPSEMTEGRQFGELRKVRQWLDRMRIESMTEWLDYFGGWRVLALTTVGEVSIICHDGSYGGPEGLLEYWDKKRMEDSVGWQSAEDVIAYIRKIMKGVKSYDS